MATSLWLLCLLASITHQVCGSNYPWMSPWIPDTSQLRDPWPRLSFPTDMWTSGDTQPTPAKSNLWSLVAPGHLTKNPIPVQRRSSEELVTPEPLYRDYRRSVGKRMRDYSLEGYRRSVGKREGDGDLEDSRRTTERNGRDGSLDGKRLRRRDMTLEGYRRSVGKRSGDVDYMTLEGYRRSVGKRTLGWEVAMIENPSSWHLRDLIGMDFKDSPDVVREEKEKQLKDVENESEEQRSRDELGLTAERQKDR